MRDRRLLSAAALAILIVVALPPASHGDLNLQLMGDTAKVTWTINASQNMTAFTHTLIYPANISTTLTGSELFAFTSALQASIQQKVSSATVSDIVVHISSNSASLTCSDNCAPQWLNATAQFAVHEPLKTIIGASLYDLSWKQIRLDQELTANNIDFNGIGKYLAPALLPFLQAQSSSSSTIVTVNGKPARLATYQSLTNPIVLFDTTSLTTPINQWSHTQDIFSQSQTWTSPQKGGFNSSAIQRLTELGETVITRYLTDATYHTQITTPLNASTQGNIIVLRSSGWDQLLLAAIIAPLGLLVGASILEWRVTGRTRQPARKGGKTRERDGKQQSR